MSEELRRFIAQHPRVMCDEIGPVLEQLYDASAAGLVRVDRSEYPALKLSVTDKGREYE